MQPSDDLEAITDAVLGSSRVLVAIASRSLAMAADEVTLPQYRALVVLQSRGPQPANALAAELGIAASGVTRLCDRLETKGLIAREPVEGNRRELCVRVTDAGAQLVATVSRRRRRELHRVVAAMPPRHRRSLARTLEAFNDAAGEVPEGQWYLGWA
jgi:DNA-binding MarR family transcriptional regulator